MAVSTEEMEAALAVTSDRLRRIDLLNELAYCQVDFHPDRIKLLSDEALELATTGDFATSPYRQGIAAAKLNLAWFYIRKSDNLEAVARLVESLAAAEEIDSDLYRGRCYNAFGLAYSQMGDFATSLEYLLKLEALSQRPSAQMHVRNRATLFSNLAALYLELHEPQTALAYLARARKMACEIEPGEALALIADNESAAFYQLGEYASALTAAFEAVSLNRSISSAIHEAESHNSVGAAYQALGDPTQALASFQRAACICQSAGDRHELIRSLLGIADVEARSGESKAALAHLEQALALARESGGRSDECACYRSLAAVHKGCGDFEKALACHEQYHTIDREVFSEAADRRVKSLSITHQLETARREAEIYQLRNVALQEEIAQREGLIADLDAFAHMVAHDLKSPLTGVLGFAEVLQAAFAESDRGHLSDATCAELLQRIARLASKMDSIITSLLMLAHVRDRAVVLTRVDMEAIVSESCRRMQWLIDEVGAEIILPERWPAAMGYAPWIEEVWANYISNAVKYGGRPPKIWLGAEQAPDRGCVRFWIRDNGRGISAELQSQAFAAFNRLGETRMPGYGLGLNIARRIVEKLGGEVRLDSAPGQGSIFSFTLPA